MLGNNESKGCFYCANLLSYFFCYTNSIFLWLVYTQKSTMTCLHINNNSSTTELSTIIWIPCGKDVLPCLWWIYCTNLMFFTTQVKTKTVPAMGYSTSIILIQHKSLQRNLIPCQQLLLINPSEPTTPLPSPQCGKTEASEISNTFCWLNFPDFSSGATRYDWLNFSDFFHQEPRDVINLNFLIFHQRALDMENQEIQINKRYHIFYSIVIVRTAGSGGALCLQRDSPDFRTHNHLWTQTDLFPGRSSPLCEDMEKLPMIDIIGKLVSNFR